MSPSGGRWIALAGLSAAFGAAAMSWWVDRRAKGHCYRELADVPRRQVAIVLGARVNPNGSPSAALEDRLATAWDLYRSGRVEKILASGDGHAPEYDEPAAMKRWLCDRGVPAEHVATDGAGLRTLDSMQRATQHYHVTSAVICTQQFHLPRAVFLALRAGIDAVGLSADRRYVARTEDHLREFVAKAVAFLDSYVLRR